MFASLRTRVTLGHAPTATGDHTAIIADGRLPTAAALYKLLNEKPRRVLHIRAQASVTERTKPPGANPGEPLLTLVVAASENGVIGNRNQLPWRLPADLKHFKSVTMGKPMLMGRKTFESIGKALPGRRSLVLTRDASFRADGAERVGSVEEALERVRGEPELAVIGGEEVFRACLPRARRMHFTRVHASLVGDVRMPPFDWNEWHCVERTTHPADEKNAYAMTFFLLER
jgi:dihydrofolate reductase